MNMYKLSPIVGLSGFAIPVLLAPSAWQLFHRIPTDTVIAELVSSGPPLLKDSTNQSWQAISEGGGKIQCARNQDNIYADMLLYSNQSNLEPDERYEINRGGDGSPENTNFRGYHATYETNQYGKVDFSQQGVISRLSIDGNAMKIAQEINNDPRKRILVKKLGSILKQCAAAAPS